MQLFKPFFSRPRFFQKKPEPNTGQGLCVRYFIEPTAPEHKCRYGETIDLDGLVAHPYQYVPPNVLLNAFFPHIFRVWERTGSSREFFGHRTFHLFVLAADSYMTVPASERSHHAYPAGLLQHSIEVAEQAMRRATPQRLRAFFSQTRWEDIEDLVYYCVIARALFHDWGKLVTDYRIVFPDQRTGQYRCDAVLNNPDDLPRETHWPLTQTLGQRLREISQPSLRRFELIWRPDRHLKHESYAPRLNHTIESQLASLPQSSVLDIIFNPETPVFRAVTDIVTAADRASSTLDRDGQPPHAVLGACILGALDHSPQRLSPSDQYPCRQLDSGLLAFRFPDDVVELAEAVAKVPESDLLGLMVSSRPPNELAQNLAHKMADARLLSLNDRGEHIIASSHGRIIVLSSELSNVICAKARARSQAASLSDATEPDFGFSISTPQPPMDIDSPQESAPSNPFSGIDLATLGDPVEMSMHSPASTSACEASVPVSQRSEEETATPPLNEQAPAPAIAARESYEPIRESEPDATHGLSVDQVRQFLTWLQKQCAASPPEPLTAQQWIELDPVERPRSGLFAEIGVALYVEKKLIKAYCKKHKMPLAEFSRQLLSSDRVVSQAFERTGTTRGPATHRLQFVQLTKPASSAAAGDLVEAFMEKHFADKADPERTATCAPTSPPTCHCPKPLVRLRPYLAANSVLSPSATNADAEERIRLTPYMLDGWFSRNDADLDDFGPDMTAFIEHLDADEIGYEADGDSVVLDAAASLCCMGKCDAS